MKKPFLAVALFLPLVCLLGWTLFLSFSQHISGEVKVSVMGYDPRDLLSGHYIAYQIDWDKTDCSQFRGGKCPSEEFCHERRWGRQCRFYIPEEHAKKLDDLFRHRSLTGTQFEVIYAYRPGHKPMAKELLINGKPWRMAL